MTPQDQIDRLAGLPAGSPLAALRRQRPDFVDGSEACRAAVLTPPDTLTLDHAVRAALATRMARLLGDSALAETYRQHLATLSPSADETRIATGVTPQHPRLAAITAHADLVTIRPRDCRRGDIEALAHAGLAEPAIVALSELIAFVNYEARVIAGLRLLEALS